MEREDIIRMAREAGGLPDPMVFIGAYERFAALVEAAEREACARFLEETDICGDAVMDELAAAIRARGES